MARSGEAQGERGLTQSALAAPGTRYATFGTPMGIIVGVAVRDLDEVRNCGDAGAVNEPTAAMTAAMR